MEIAVLGTGLMGAPMARNLLKAGYAVRAWNRTHEKAKALEADGATAVERPEQAVDGADVVITMLSDGPATAAVLDRVIDAVAPGTVWIEMSSVKPGEARAQADALAKRDALHLDAPVSGGTKGAEAGTLAIMVGGAQETLDRVAPVLEAMGRPVLVGPSGAGQLAKLANQAIVAITIGAVAEATLMIEKGGGDPAAVRQALKGGFADSTILQQHGKRMTERNFEPGGPSKFQLKDIVNAIDEAEAAGLSLPLLEQVRDRFTRLVHEMDMPEVDHSGLYLELRERNGMEVSK